jgi:DNA polymerase III, tau subunit (EC 2.7.7.7)
MSYIPFARKYRPKTFKELIGQEIPATILKNAFLYQKYITLIYLQDTKEQVKPPPQGYLQKS